jgi:hypothetical protein
VDRRLVRPPRVRLRVVGTYSMQRPPKRVDPVTITARYPRLMDAALARSEAWRARKALAKQFLERATH